MKKNIINTLAICVMLALILSSCDKITNGRERRKELYEYETITTGWAVVSSIVTVDYYISEMHYKVFTNPQGGLFVINITKDSLCIANKASVIK